ncbi:hypothetical protein D3C86_1340030 [compost metagenome]
MSGPSSGSGGSWRASGVSRCGARRRATSVAIAQPRSNSICASAMSAAEGITSGAETAPSRHQNTDEVTWLMPVISSTSTIFWGMARDTRGWAGGGVRWPRGWLPGLRSRTEALTSIMAFIRRASRSPDGSRSLQPMKMALKPRWPSTSSPCVQIRTEEEQATMPPRWDSRDNW